MKKVSLLFLLLYISLSSAQSTITKNIGDFSTLKVYSGIEVELIKSTVQKIEISGEKSKKVKIKNTDGTLKILLRFPEVSANGKVLVKLYYNTKIMVIDANEGSIITGKNITQDKLTVKTQERAFINLVIKVKEITVKAISGGIIKLTGTADNQQVKVDLYGNYHGYLLNVSGNSIVKSGTGAKAEILTKGTLTAKVNFGGSIFYKGNPSLIKDKKVAGGIIQKRN